MGICSLCSSLYDQLMANKTKEEEELAERRKLMYGVRPMDDEEYKDYEQMERSRKEREKREKERMGREEEVFSCPLCSSVMHRKDTTRHDHERSGGAGQVVLWRRAHL